MLTKIIHFGTSVKGAKKVAKKPQSAAPYHKSVVLIPVS